MRIAVIADVHANLPALEAVLDAIDAEACDDLVCLGDLVGYGAQPRECVALVRDRIRSCVLGNHDRDVVTRDPSPGTRSSARSVQTWTRAQLDQGALDYLGQLPGHLVHESQTMAVHGCFLNDRHYYGYVTSTMLAKNLEAIRDRSDWPPVAMCGHTHIPLVAWLRGQRIAEHTKWSKMEWPPDAGAVLLNPGSVGQPRDGDPRASFMILDRTERRAELCRVEYDIDAAAAAIVACGLPPELATRLKEGR